MAFSLDRTRCYVRIEEPNLISIHRSTSSIVPIVDYSHGHPCDAFICAAREYNMFRVYIGLYDFQLKSNIVFVADPVGFDNKKTAHLIKEAETFLSNIGFDMEQVNMEFSPATREVIMRDMKVMREPPLAIRLDAALLAIEGLTIEKNELLQKAARSQKSFKAEVDKLRQQLVLANTATNEHMEKPELDEATVAALIKDCDLLRAELAVNRAELDAVRKEHVHSHAKMKKTQIDQMALDTLAKKAKEESRVLREEACVAREAAAAAKQEAHNTGQEVLVLKELVKAAQEDARIAKEEAVSLHEKVRIAQDEVHAARQEIQDLHNAARMIEDEAKSQSDISRDHASDSVDHHMLQQELDRLQSELDTIMVAKANENNALRAALAIADGNLSYERAKNESALQEMDALERNASVELKKLKKMVDSLTDEKHMLESMAGEMKVKAMGEIEHLQQVNQAQRRAAIKKVKALKEEMRQLSEARVAMTSPFSASLSTVAAKTTSTFGCDLVTLSNDADSASSNEVFTSPFGSSDNSEFISFEPDSTLQSIPYAILDDVVEVHRSFNKIQAAPLGKQVHSCDGFVCLVQDRCQSMMVYVVWLMKDSGEVLICHPKRIPEERAVAMNMVHEGIGYFERVGFIMDELILDSNPEQRQNQIDSLSFFHKISMESAA